MKTTFRNAPDILRAVRATYPVLNWVRNRPMYVRRALPALEGLPFDEVRFSNRGNEPEAHVRRTARLISLRGADVLLIGVGRGDETRHWLEWKPKRVTAVDPVADAEGWNRFPDVQFLQMDARSLAFENDSFDVVGSMAVLEHVDGIEQCVAEMARVVRPSGVVFAGFGPLWHTHGGAHYLGSYEHLWLSEADFERYLVARDIPYEIDEGLRWLRAGMFSKRTYGEYHACFAEHFEFLHVMLFVSAEARRFRVQRHLEWQSLRRRFAEHDLLTSGAAVWMTPRKARRED